MNKKKTRTQAENKELRLRVIIIFLISILIFVIIFFIISIKVSFLLFKALQDEKLEINCYSKEISYIFYLGFNESLVINNTGLLRESKDLLYDWGTYNQCEIKRHYGI